jgi:hypothetical protein
LYHLRQGLHVIASSWDYHGGAESRVPVRGNPGRFRGREVESPSRVRRSAPPRLVPPRRPRWGRQTHWRPGRRPKSRRRHLLLLRNFAAAGGGPRTCWRPSVAELERYDREGERPPPLRFRSDAEADGAHVLERGRAAGGPRVRPLRLLLQALRLPRPHHPNLTYSRETHVRPGFKKRRGKELVVWEAQT